MGTARFLDPSSIPLKRHSGGNIWATLAYLTQGVVLLLVLAAVGLLFLPVIETSHQLEARKAELQRRIAAGQEQQQQYQIETEHMKRDPAYVEHIARDQLNLGKPGETIMRFDSYQQESPQVPRTVEAVPENESQ